MVSQARGPRLTCLRHRKTDLQQGKGGKTPGTPAAGAALQATLAWRPKGLRHGQTGPWLSSPAREPTSQDSLAASLRAGLRGLDSMQPSLGSLPKPQAEGGGAEHELMIHAWPGDRTTAGSRGGTSRVKPVPQG